MPPTTQGGARRARGADRKKGGDESTVNIQPAYGRLPVGEIKNKKTQCNRAAARGLWICRAFAEINGVTARGAWGCEACVSKHNKGLENGGRVSSQGAGAACDPLSPNKVARQRSERSVLIPLRALITSTSKPLHGLAPR